MPFLPPHTIRPVILCGGAGTRLWPVSRQKMPKQFLPLMSDQSLLQQTAKRLSGEQFAPAVIVSAEDQRLFVKQQLEDVAVAVDAILLEPVGRNTAAAATLAAAWAQSIGGNDLLLLMPSDHIIEDQAAFMRAIEIGAHHAQNGAIVTFGAQPSEPNTQYGYIEVDAEAQSDNGAYRIARFHEKPSAVKAAEYVATGRFFWNCGIFLARASTILHEMRAFLPENLKTISEALSGAAQEGVFIRPDPEIFARVESVSIDHGVMEKTALGVVIPVQMQWSDVGAWDAVWKLGQKDSAENVTQGNVVALDTRRSLLRSEGGLVLTAVGLENMVVIAVRDAVFVAPMERVSEVKKIVEKLTAENTDVMNSAS